MPACLPVPCWSPAYQRRPGSMQAVAPPLQQHNQTTTPPRRPICRYLSCSVLSTGRLAAVPTPPPRLPLRSSSKQLCRYPVTIVDMSVWQAHQLTDPLTTTRLVKPQRPTVTITIIGVEPEAVRYPPFTLYHQLINIFLHSCSHTSLQMSLVINNRVLLPEHTQWMTTSYTL